jgi:hypothetical protein
MHKEEKMEIKEPEVSSLGIKIRILAEAVNFNNNLYIIKPM